LRHKSIFYFHKLHQMTPLCHDTIYPPLCNTVINICNQSFNKSLSLISFSHIADKSWSNWLQIYRILDAANVFRLNKQWEKELHKEYK
jgi:hypothetical protein